MVNYGEMNYVHFILACSGVYCTQQNVQIIPSPFTVLAWKSTSNLSEIFKSSC